MSEHGYVLDASAILAALQDEPGAELVYTAAQRSIVGCVNYSEVIAKLCEQGSPQTFAADALDELRLTVTSFDKDQAVLAGGLRPITRSSGLSMGDRACLALAIKTKRTVLTSDRRLAAAKTDAQVELIR